MPGSEETASIPFCEPAAAPLRCNVVPPRTPGDADELETRRRRVIDQVARLAVVAQDRVQPAARVGHQAQPVLADVGIFPAEQRWPGSPSPRSGRRRTGCRSAAPVRGTSSSDSPSNRSTDLGWPLIVPRSP